jgi:hypothetical protein
MARPLRIHFSTPVGGVKPRHDPLTIHLTQPGLPDRTCTSVAVHHIIVVDSIPAIRDGSRRFMVADPRVPGGKFPVTMPVTRVTADTTALLKLCNTALMAGYWAVMGGTYLNTVDAPQLTFTDNTQQRVNFTISTDSRITLYVLAAAGDSPYTLVYDESDAILARMLGWFASGPRGVGGVTALRDTHYQLHLLGSRATVESVGGVAGRRTDLLETVAAPPSASVAVSQRIPLQLVYVDITPQKNLLKFEWRDSRGEPLPEEYSLGYTVTLFAVVQ